MKIHGDEMTLDPVIPGDWPGFSLRYRRGQAVYEITVENPERVQRGVLRVELDGRPLNRGQAPFPAENEPVPVVPLEQAFIKHRVRVIMGNGQRGGHLVRPGLAESHHLAGTNLRDLCDNTIIIATLTCYCLFPSTRRHLASRPRPITSMRPSSRQRFITTRIISRLTLGQSRSISAMPKGLVTFSKA